MSKYSPQEKAGILAQARRNTAIVRAEALRKRHALELEKKKGAERQRAVELQQSPRTSAAPEFSRDELIDLIAKGLALFLRRQL